MRLIFNAVMLGIFFSAMVGGFGIVATIIYFAIVFHHNTNHETGEINW
jgi:hypothetical protein